MALPVKRESNQPMTGRINGINWGRIDIIQARLRHDAAWLVDDLPECSDEYAALLRNMRRIDVGHNLIRMGWVAPLGKNDDTELLPIVEWCRAKKIDFRVIGHYLERHYAEDECIFIGMIYVRRRYATMLKLRWA